MKGNSFWSYRPYAPPLTEVGEIYVCRVAPFEDKIRLEWLPAGETSYSVYFRKREEGEFVLSGSTEETEFELCRLERDTDYEFYVSAGNKKSRVRLARCGESVGVTVNYLHPDDDVYAFSGHYLCSPSLVFLL